jgi:hypothetical protein
MVTGVEESAHHGKVLWYFQKSDRWNVLLSDVFILKTLYLVPYPSQKTAYFVFFQILLAI